MASPKFLELTRDAKITKQSKIKKNFENYPQRNIERYVLVSGIDIHDLGDGNSRVGLAPGGHKR